MKLSHALARGVLVAALAVAGVVPVRAQQGYDLFQQALTKERAAGDLDAAIALYARVVKDYAADRALAAKALMRMAGCYDQLGSPEALKIYQRVATEFSDLRDAAAEARRRLKPAVTATLSPPPGLVRKKRQPLGRIVNLPDGVLSPNGKVVATQPVPLGDIVVQDVATGQRRLLAAATVNERACGQPTWSRDGSHIAYGWCDASGLRAELRVIKLAGGTPRAVPLRNIVSAALFDWSPDGSSILALVRPSTSAADQLALISVADGVVRILRSADSGSGRPRSDAARFSSDSRYVLYTPQNANAGIAVLRVDTADERPLFPASTPDLFLAFTPKGRDVLFVSDRLGTFDLWSVGFEDGRAIGVPQRLVEDIGPITARGLTDAGAIYYTTPGLTPGAVTDLYVAPLDPSTGVATGTASALSSRRAGHLSHPIWSPDGREIAYKVGAAGTSGGIFIQSVQSGAERALDVSLGTIGQVDWSPDGRWLIVACVRDTTPEIVRVDLATGAVSTVVGGKAEDAALAGKTPGRGPLSQPRWLPDNRSILFVAGQRVEVRDIESGSQRTVVDSGVDVQSASPSPDGRSLAFVSGTNLMVAAIADGRARTLTTLQSRTSARILTWSRDGRHVVFADRTSAMNPPGASEPYYELWRIPAAGGARERMNIAGDAVYQPAISPDGRHIAFTVAADSRLGVHVLDGLFRR